jgi:hypothetical protein
LLEGEKKRKGSNRETYKVKPYHQNGESMENREREREWERERKPVIDEKGMMERVREREIKTNGRREIFLSFSPPPLSLSLQSLIDIS